MLLWLKLAIVKPIVKRGVTLQEAVLHQLWTTPLELKDAFVGELLPGVEAQHVMEQALK